MQVVLFHSNMKSKSHGQNENEIQDQNKHILLSSFITHELHIFLLSVDDTNLANCKLTRKNPPESTIMQLYPIHFRFGSEASIQPHTFLANIFV
jgi:hypothetical protein